MKRGFILGVLFLVLIAALCFVVNEFVSVGRVVGLESDSFGNFVTKEVLGGDPGVVEGFSCVDSDGKDNFLKKGTVTHYYYGNELGSWTDLCSSAYVVEDYYCLSSDPSGGGDTYFNARVISSEVLEGEILEPVSAPEVRVSYKDCKDFGDDFKCYDGKCIVSLHTCGDGHCDSDENCVNCQSDCAPCCYDTDMIYDGGLMGYFELGRVYASGGVQGVDRCIDRDHLLEYSCAGGVGVSEVVYCPGACLDNIFGFIGDPVGGACGVCNISGAYDECYSDSQCGANSKCMHCQCVEAHEPSDTPCTENNGGYEFTIGDNWAGLNGETTGACNRYNVKSNDVGINLLDYAVDDALDCCLYQNKVDQENSGSCLYARKHGTTIRDCLTYYFASELGSMYYAGYEQEYPVIGGYFYAETCCEGGGVLEDICEEGGGAVDNCAPKKYHNRYVWTLTCEDYNCQWHYQPAFVTSNLLNTGTCVDWSILTTTLFRKTNYFPEDSVLSLGLEGHYSNLVWMDELGKWIVFNYGLLVYDPWGGYRNYCDDINGYCGNDKNKRDCGDGWQVGNIYGC